MSALDLTKRRSHGAYHSEDEALQAAHDLNYLLNGTPMGWVMAISRKMGAWVLWSVPTAEYNKAFGQ